MRLFGVSFLIIFLVFLGCNKKQENTGNSDLNNKLKLTTVKNRQPYYFPAREEFGELKDGEFQGEELNYEEKIILQIIVTNNKVDDIKFLTTDFSNYIKQRGIQKKLLDNIKESFLKNQNPGIDSVTGATLSVHSFKIAFTKALWNASRKINPMDDTEEMEKKDLIEENKK